MSRKDEIKEIGKKIKTGRKSYVDEVVAKSPPTKQEKPKNKKITLSLPEDVIKTLWIMKAERGYSSISQIVAEAVRKFASEK